MHTDRRVTGEDSDGWLADCMHTDLLRSHVLNRCPDCHPDNFTCFICDRAQHLPDLPETQPRMTPVTSNTVDVPTGDLL